MKLSTLVFLARVLFCFVTAQDLCAMDPGVLAAFVQKFKPRAQPRPIDLVGIAAGHMRRQEDVAAFEILRNYERSDNYQALILLAMCYQNGRAIQVNRVKAFELFKRAADLDSVYAMHQVAFGYFEGRDITQDFAEALRYALMAVEEDPESLFASVSTDFLLAYFCWHGFEPFRFGKDQRRAVAFFKWAIEKKDIFYEPVFVKCILPVLAIDKKCDSAALFAFAKCYCEKRQYEDAYFLFKTAARVGHVDAGYLVSELRSQGYGSDKEDRRISGYRARFLAASNHTDQNVLDALIEGSNRTYFMQWLFP